MANTFLNKDGLSHLIAKLKTYITSQISAHTGNKNNPHGVTKAQVGLGSVANIDQSKAIKSISRSGTTFTATALDGTTTTFTQQDNNTTYGVATSSANGLMSSGDKANLDSHLANKSNPHGVTAAQVGAASKSHAHTSIESVELTNQDLNNYKSNSVQFLYAAGGNTVKNVPSGVTAFGVYCYRSDAGWFTQELISTEGKKYFRVYNASSWTSWNIIIDSSNVASYKVNNAGYADSSGKVNGHTVNADVPSNAKFTDTTYSDATTSAHGLMTAADKSKLNGIASGATKNASTVKSFTLSASSWSSGSYTISDSLITASSNQEVLPAVGITAAQYNALSKAQIVDGGQAAGSLTLKALGTVPTIDIPIRVVFRGTI